MSTDFGMTMLQFVSDSPDEFEDSAALGVDWTIDASDVEAEETGKNENGQLVTSYQEQAFLRFSVKWRVLLRLEYKSHCIRRHARLFIRNLFVLQDMSYNFIKDQVGIQNTPTLY